MYFIFFWRGSERKDTQASCNRVFSTSKKNLVHPRKKKIDFLLHWPTLSNGLLVLENMSNQTIAVFYGIWQESGFLYHRHWLDSRMQHGVSLWNGQRVFNSWFVRCRNRIRNACQPRVSFWNGQRLSSSRFSEHSTRCWWSVGFERVEFVAEHVLLVGAHVSINQEKHLASRVHWLSAIIFVSASRARCDFILVLRWVNI